PEAIAERVLNDLAAADWTAVVVGAVRSTFIDGPPVGTRTVHAGTSIDLVRAVNLANCQKSTACTVSELDAVTAQRPWGVNNPRWQLFGYGRMRDLLPSSAIDVPWYAILLAGDDPAHAADVIAVRAEAFGPRGAHAVVALLAVIVITEPKPINDDPVPLSQPATRPAAPSGAPDSSAPVDPNAAAAPVAVAAPASENVSPPDQKLLDRRAMLEAKLARSPN